jgi:hypothetical protein
MRRLLAVATLAALVPAPFAAAATDPRPTPPPDCAATLALADPNANDGCDSLGDAPLAPFRQLVLAVQTGVATATLACGGAPGPSVTLTVAAPFTATTTLLYGGGYCWVIVTSLYPGTTAVATNTSGPNLT